MSATGSTTKPKREAPRPYARTGVNTLKTAIKARGMKSIDGRSYAAIEVKQMTSDLVADLGGEERITAQKRTLVAMAARALLYLNAVDAWIMQHVNAGGRLVNKRNRSLLPVLRERQSIAEHLAKLMDRLGLERVAPEPMSLADYVESRSRTRDVDAETSDASDAPPDAPPPAADRDAEASSSDAEEASGGGSPGRGDASSGGTVEHSEEDPS